MIKGTPRSVGTIIVLSIITCGIYYLWWQYQIGNEINAALGKEAVKPVYVLIGLLCFPLILYYMYTVDQALVELGLKTNTNYTSNFVLWIVLSFFYIGSYVYMIQAQTALNNAWSSSIY